MVQQIEIILKPKHRGFHLVTSEILSQLIHWLKAKGFISKN